jgi:lipoprotein-releasing system permease protein
MCKSVLRLQKYSSLNTERFIASRLSKGRHSGFTRSVVRLGIGSIALGMVLMILSVAIVTGFQREIREKIIGIRGHIQISMFSSNTLLEKKPISIDRDFIPHLKSISGVRHIQTFASSAGIVRAGESSEGCVLKGAGSDFDWAYLQRNLVEGRIPEYTDSVAGDEILISRWLASRLELKQGDKLSMYFMGQQPRVRVFRICGIYATAMEEEIDRQFIFGDIRHLQTINGWKPDEVEGLELFISDFSRLEEMREQVYQLSDFDLDVHSIDQEYPQIFDWLDLLDINVFIILFMMLMVAGVNMVSTLLILVLERTQMVGILKSMGAGNKSIRKVFISLNFSMLWKGLLAGNILALGLAFLQQRYSLIPLNPESYYMSTVPIHLDLWGILLLNAGTVAVLFLIMFIPLTVIRRMNPVRSLRFE